MRVCVSSYGGCGTNALVDAIEESGIKVRTPQWKKYDCHAIRPPSGYDLGVYLYSHPPTARKSQVRRNFLETNIGKMSRGAPPGMNNFYGLANHQMLNWAKGTPDYPVVLMRYECMHDNLGELSELLGKDIGLRVVDRTTPPQSEEDDSCCAIASRTYKQMPDFQVVRVCRSPHIDSLPLK
jgi:hypothetical protein